MFFILRGNRFSNGAALRRAGAVRLDLQCKFNVNFRQNLMQIVTRGKRAQTEDECLSSVVCVFGRLRAKACGSADLGVEARSGAVGKAQGCRAPTSSHGLQNWWCLQHSIGTAWPRRVRIPLLLAH